MLNDDELEELAADIKANGLQHPLVIAEVEGKPLLVDGRNRREACRRVGIVPDYVLLNGQDPIAYILSANINRRHMTKGQRAVATCLVSKRAARDKAKQVSVSAAYVGKALTVLNHAPDLADQVLSGSLPLDKAYEEARIRKGRVDTHESRFNALKAASPTRGWIHFKQLLRCLA